MKSYNEYMLGWHMESAVSVIEYGVKHYAIELKKELRYIRKKCKCAAKGKSIGTYAHFAMNELTICSTRYQIIEYLKDSREMLNENLLAYNDNSSELTKDELDRVLELFYKGVQELDDLEWMVKCVKRNYEIMRVVIAHPGRPVNRWRFIFHLNQKMRGINHVGR